MVTPVPELVGVSDLRVGYREIFERIKHAPVILTQRSHAVAVMVSPELWNRLLERLEDCLAERGERV